MKFKGKRRVFPLYHKTTEILLVLNGVRINIHPINV